MNSFYVYGLFHPNGILPFYIGKGIRGRKDFHLWEVRRNINNEKYFLTGNTLKKNVIKKILNDGSEPLLKIFENNLSNEQAIELEQELIERYGRRNLRTGCLVNLTNGGEGTVCCKRTVDSLIKQSERQKKSIIRYNPFTHEKETFSCVQEMLRLDKVDCWQSRVVYRCCRGELIQLKRFLFFYEEEFTEEVLQQRLIKFENLYSFGKNKPLKCL